MNLLKIALSLAALTLSLLLHAQTADEVVNKHIDAIGGKDAILKIKSLVADAELSVMGSTLNSQTTIVAGKGFKNVANFNGQDIIQVITPTNGWTINPLAGMTSPAPLPDDQVKAAQSALDFGGDLLNYQSKGSKVELNGKETINGVETLKLKLTDKDGKESFYFIDPSTYYIVRQKSTTNMNGQDVEAVSDFSDFRKTDIGYVMPYTTVSNQGFEITTRITKVEFNKDIDLAIFEMPK